MTTSPPPSKPPGKAGKAGTPKPFLGDDDLSEIDAWVETFDALHMGPDPGTPPPAPPPEPPAPSEPPAAQLAPEDAPPDRVSSVDIDLGDRDEPPALDDPMIDGGTIHEIAPMRFGPDAAPAGHAEPRPPSVTAIDGDAFDDAFGPDHEDDFSAMSDATALADGPLVPRRDELDDDLADHAFGGGGEDDGVF